MVVEKDTVPSHGGLGGPQSGKKKIKYRLQILNGIARAYDKKLGFRNNFKLIFLTP